MGRRAGYAWIVNGIILGTSAALAVWATGAWGHGGVGATGEEPYPHGYCYRWHPVLIAMHLIGDGLIWTAYIWIPLALVEAVRQVYQHLKVEERRLLWWSAAFVTSCGLTHGMDMLVVAVPKYWEQAMVKLICAAISIRAAFLLTRVVGDLRSEKTRRTDDDGRGTDDDDDGLA